MGARWMVYEYEFANECVSARSMISYPNYKFIFPIKALGMFAKQWGDIELL
jgi:lanosterol synthase